MRPHDIEGLTANAACGAKDGDAPRHGWVFSVGNLI